MKLGTPRDLANRSLGLLSNARGLMGAARKGLEPGPLWLALRAANALARRIAEQPTPVATATQRRTLLAAGTQIRAMTARLIVSAASHDPKSVEAQLAELVTRTLELIERVTADQTALSGDAIRVRVVEGHSSSKEPGKLE